MSIRLDQNSFDLQGICPVCWGEDLTYSSSAVEWDSLYYDWTCDDCDSAWTEWYTINFYSQHLDYDWKQKKSTDDPEREWKTPFKS